VQYIGEMREESPGKPLSGLIDDAAMRFNLSPLDAEALLRLFASEQAGTTESSG
jgi:hypothetical protein